MKKILKSASLLIILLLIQVASFAAEKAPDVYVSRSPVTDVHNVWGTSWVLFIIAFAVIVFIIAFFSAQEKESHTAAH
jgi:multisubunit Na+/H+ antiporter MnhG subunit